MTNYKIIEALIQKAKFSFVLTLIGVNTFHNVIHQKSPKATFRNSIECTKDWGPQEI